MIPLLLAAKPVVKGLESTQVLVLLLDIALMLGVARWLGEQMRRWGQPAVVGELLAGVVLGPSVLGALAPQVEAFLFPPVEAQANLLAVVSMLGVLTLLVVTGLEIDLGLIARKARTALSVSWGSLCVNLCCGFTLGTFVPDEFLGHGEDRMVFCLFMAVAMSIAAIPVIAKVLMDMKLIRRDIGQVTLAAAMNDDSVGWILLSVVAGLARTGSVSFGSVLYSVSSVLLFALFGLTLGRRLVAMILAFVDDRYPGNGVQISLLLVLACAFSAFTQWLGIEAVLGAFMVGIMASTAPRLRVPVPHHLEALAANFLAPIFFAAAGLKVNLTALAQPRLVVLAVAVLVVAVTGTYTGTYIGGWLARLSHWERLAMGASMTPRGAMGVIVATVGLNLGVLTAECYSIIVGMALVTSLLGPPLLRWALTRVEVTAEEKARMRQERLAAASFVRGVNKVLVPSRGGHNIQLAAQLLGHLSQRKPLDITLLYASVPDQEADPQEAVEVIKAQLQRTGAAPARVLNLKGKGLVDVITKEAERGYNLLVIGASPVPTGPTLHPLTDSILQASPVPAVIVRAHPSRQQGLLDIHRILVPTVGTHYSNHAVEVASVLALSLSAMVTICHVVPQADTESLLVGLHTQELGHSFGERIVDSQADLARHIGAEVDTLVLEGNSPEKLLLEQAKDYDLVVMGTHMRPLSGVAFLGHRVEALLRKAPCAVMVVSSM